MKGGGNTLRVQADIVSGAVHTPQAAPARPKNFLDKPLYTCYHIIMELKTENGSSFYVDPLSDILCCIYSELKPVICINLLKRKLFDTVEKLHTVFLLFEKDYKELPLTDHFQVHYIELEDARRPALDLLVFAGTSRLLRVGCWQSD